MSEHKLHEEKQAAKVLMANFNDLINDDLEMKVNIIEGETDLFETIDLVVHEIHSELALVGALDEQIKKMKSRLDRKKQKVERLKTSVATAMEMCELKTLETSITTITRKKVAPKLVVTDEAAIPSEYYKQADPTLDKRGLTSALKDSQEIPGARLSNGSETIQFRWN